MSFKAKKLIRWLFGVGLTLLFLGIAFAVGNRAWYRTRTWRVVDRSLELSVGPVSTQEFAINVEENFLILLEVDRDVPPKIAEGVLGTGKLVSEHLVAHGFKMRWAVLKNGSLMKQGLSDGNGEGYGGSRMGRILGFFPAERGQKYRIDLDVLEDGSALKPYHPTLKVQVDLFTLDGYAMAEGFSELAGLVVAGIGVLLIAPVLPLWGWLITKKSRSSLTKNRKIPADLSRPS